jgi:hypothetical protein
MRIYPEVKAIGHGGGAPGGSYKSHHGGGSDRKGFRRKPKGGGRGRGKFRSHRANEVDGGDEEEGDYEEPEGEENFEEDPDEPPGFIDSEDEAGEPNEEVEDDEDEDVPYELQEAFLEATSFLTRAKKQRSEVEKLEASSRKVQEKGAKNPSKTSAGSRASFRVPSVVLWDIGTRTSCVQSSHNPLRMVKARKRTTRRQGHTIL